ncbi:hypothetical protein KC19_11G096000 [Ceratodon purpureus]|uniref:Uncharacterized protein n=1 Tax=Ceratodon purpureus TaxID=3225 RepID=A0A8T0GGV5_CERPU|nr:hypothetical protein KC19_11G096000 [Ceratodon purpureus]
MQNSCMMFLLRLTLLAAIIHRKLDRDSVGTGGLSTVGMIVYTLLDNPYTIVMRDMITEGTKVLSTAQLFHQESQQKSRPS